MCIGRCLVHLHLRNQIRSLRCATALLFFIRKIHLLWLSVWHIFYLLLLLFTLLKIKTYKRRGVVCYVVLCCVVMCPRLIHCVLSKKEKHAHNAACFCHEVFGWIKFHFIVVPSKIKICRFSVYEPTHFSLPFYFKIRLRWGGRIKSSNLASKQQNIELVWVLCPKMMADGCVQRTFSLAAK